MTPAINQHAANPATVGPLAGATHQGIAGTPGEGPYLILTLRLEGENILDAAYQTYGCPAAMASGSITAQILRNRTVQQALLVTAKDIDLLLGGLPEGKGHCAQLAVDALQDALKEFKDV
jgi:NifU-like protein involved in Fe-S cluster formation